MFDRTFGSGDVLDIGFWIPDRRWPIVAQSEIQHWSDVEFITGCHHGHVREYTHVGIVEDAVVSRAVGSCKATAIKTERNRQVLKCDFLEDMIEASLQERAVNIDDRTHTALGHPACESDSVCFTNSCVEESIGKFITDPTQLVSFTHGGGEDADLGVTLHGVKNRIAHRIGIRTRGRFLDRDDFILLIASERRRCVVSHRIFTSRFKSMPLLCEDMQKDGPADLFDHFQGFSQFK